MTVDQVATAHYQAQQTLSRQVVEQSQTLWSQVDSASVLDSWLALLRDMLRFLITGQARAATLSQPYLDALADLQGIPTAPVVVNPASFAGTAADGRDLTSLLMQPALRTLGLLAAGADDSEALRSGLASLTRIVDSEISDASRVADQVGATARREWVMYVRHVTLPACGRCIILAGKVYSMRTGFQRHDRCDCTMVPFREGEAIPPSPNELFTQMSKAEQGKAFTIAGAEAVRLGADMGQVVNARRGMKVAGERLVTTEGVTRRGRAGRKMRGAVRLMPEQILADAGGDRDKAIKLLSENGYLVDRKAGQAKSRPMVVPQQRPADAVEERRRAEADAVAKVEAARRAVAEEAAREAEALTQAPGMTAAVRHASNAEGVDWAMDHIPPPTSALSKEEKQAVRNYTSSQYAQVNRYLRGQMQVDYLPKRELAAIRKTIERLDSAFTKATSPESFIVHRGVGADFATPLGADVNNPASMQALVGKTFTEKGFLSTAVGEGGTYPGSIYMMIRVPEGHEAMNVMFGTFGKAEREILLRRGTHYVVHAAYKRGPKWYVEAEIVPDDWERPDSWQPDPLGDADRGYTVDGGTKV